MRGTALDKQHERTNMRRTACLTPAEQMESWSPDLVGALIEFGLFINTVILQQRELFISVLSQFGTATNIEQTHAQSSGHV